MRRAQLILTVPALVTLIVPLLMDANHSHQMNEAWPPHARYHGAVLWGAFFPALLAPGASTWPDGTGRLEALPFAPNVIIGGLMVVLCIVGARMASRTPSA